MLSFTNSLREDFIAALVQTAFANVLENTLCVNWCNLLEIIIPYLGVCTIHERSMRLRRIISQILTEDQTGLKCCSLKLVRLMMFLTVSTEHSYLVLL